MSESELQARIIEPLLRAMGFTDVRDNSGPNEKGKDLIATKKSEFGRSLLYGIQLKKLNINASVSSRNSLGALLLQLKQAKEEKVVDPGTNARRSPDICVFITPYPLAPHVLERFHQAALEAMKLNIELVDGPRILDLIDRFAPDLMQEFSMEVQYRRQLARDLGRVPETAVALGLADDLELDNIYVDTSIRPFDDVLLLLARYPLLNDGPKCFLAKRFFLMELKREVSGWNAEPRIYDPPKAESRQEKERLAALNSMARVPRGEEVMQVDLDPVFAAVQQQVRHALSGLAALSNTPSASQLSEELQRVVTIKHRVGKFLDLVNDYWPQIVDLNREIEWDCTLTGLETRSVLNADINLHVLGEAGSGKTTLLRRFCQLTAKESTVVIPIYLPLVRVREPTETGILNACAQQLSSYGYRLNAKTTNKQQLQELSDGLLSGKFRLFLDGLDETGSNAQKLLGVIGKLGAQFPKCRIVVSGRYDFAGNRLEGGAQLRLGPFNDTQLTRFLKQWFRSEPSALNKISLWLKQNRRMREAARTPLIAALLCSLYDVGAAMPSTEIELYEGRFDLLLGKWERAKGIQPLRPDLRRRYWRFITELAFETHARESRLIPFADAVDAAANYYESNYHGAPSELVMDCVHRSIFELEPSGFVSFGHLTYQEYLVARRLVTENDLAFIWARLDRDWWVTTLRFYATIKQDITSLVRYGLSQDSVKVMEYRRLHALAKIAPWTNSDAAAEVSAIIELGSDPAPVKPRNSLRGLH